MLLFVGAESSDDRSEPLRRQQLLNYVMDVTGWNRYRAAAYIAIVRDGPLAANDIVQLTDVPQGRIYNTLDTLEGDAIMSQGRQPTIYEAHHPRSVLGDKQEEFNEKADLAINHLEQQHEIARERDDPQHPMWVMAGFSGTVRELKEEIDQANESIQIMDVDGQWINNREVRDLSRLAQRGVDIEVIGWDGWRDTLDELANSGMKVMTNEDVDASMCIIDGERVILRTGRGKTGMKVEDAGSVKIFQRAYETYRENACVAQKDG